MKSLAILVLLAVPAFAEMTADTVTLPGGAVVPRLTAGDDNAVVMTTRFAIYYYRHEEIVANRADADRHAAGVAWALEQAWTAIFTNHGFRVPDGSWMLKSRIPVTIKDIKHLGVATFSGRKKTGWIEIDVHQDIKDADLLYATCAHELFHLVQYEYDLREDHWIYDGTAVWIEDRAFPARAAAKPDSYGTRYYASDWDRTWHYPLPWENENHGYADAFLIRYLSDQEGSDFVKKVWERMGEVKGDNTGAAFEKALGGADRAWGPEFGDRFLDFAVANLIRDGNRAPGRRFRFDPGSVPLPALTTFHFPEKVRAFAGFSLFGMDGAALRTGFRGVHPQGMKYDRLDLPAGAGPGPIDVAVLMRGAKDADWGFAAVTAPPAGKWSVEEFRPSAKDEWVCRTVRLEDPARDRLYLVWSRARRESADARFTAMLLSPPVVTRFEIVEPDPDAKERRPGETDFRAVRRPVWVCVRRPWELMAGRAWRTAVTEDRGLTWRETQSRAGEKLTLRVETSRPIVAPVVVRLIGSRDSFEARLPAAGSGGNVYEASVPMADLDALCHSDDALRVEIRARDSLGRGLDGRPDTLPEVSPREGEGPDLRWIDAWEGGPLDGAVIGGTDDLGGRPVPIRREAALPVEVRRVRAEQNGVAVYDTEKGDFAPAAPAEIGLVIVFLRAMDRARAADIRLGEVAAAGTWSSDREWRGTVIWPADGPRGRRTLSIAATAADGTPLDGDPGEPGIQPDRKHVLLIDRVPVHVESVEVAGGGAVLYSARWEDFPALSHRAGRRLAVGRSAGLPASGAGTLVVTLSLSRPVGAAPAVRIAGVPVSKLESKDGRLWIGEVPSADVRGGMKGGSAPVEVEARDDAGRGLDADPRTSPRVGDGEPWWRAYESAPGGPDDGRGGIDRWHRIEAPPRMSYVVVLDASGSMKDQDKLANAKRAIRALLDQPSADVELGLVVFANTTEIRAFGFTRDRERFWKWVEPVEASGGTPLAASIDRSRELLETESHPASGAWRYRIFSDGKETAGGNVAEAIRRLDEAIARRTGQASAPSPPRVPPPRVTGSDPFPVKPASWQAHRVEVEEHQPFPWVFLVETSFSERALPDGRALLRLEERPFGIAYGSVREPDGSMRASWRVHDRPDEVRVKEVTSDQGAAAVLRLRREAEALRARDVSVADCNRRIEALVREKVR